MFSCSWQVVECSWMVRIVWRLYTTGGVKWAWLNSLVPVAMSLYGAQQIALFFSFFKKKIYQADSLGVDQWKANRKSWCRSRSVAGRIVEEMACIAPEEWLGCFAALTSCSSWTPRAKSECICGKVLAFWSSSSWVFSIIMVATL